MKAGGRPPSRHVVSSISHHRCIAIFLFTALCVAIVVTVVWKVVSDPAPKDGQAALDTDCHSQQQLSADGLHDQAANSTDCHERSSTETIDDGYRDPTAREDPSETSVPASDTIVKPDRSEEALDAIVRCSDTHLDQDQIKHLNLGLDPTIPSYAVDENGQPHEWVLQGPDYFKKAVFFSPWTGNLPSRRFMWFAHMNRKDETSSLYDQLGIDQFCSEGWVQTAISTAKEIRRQIMRYYVFYEVDELTCDMGPWDNIKHEAPDSVQHRMHVFLAKFEYLKPFHHLRLVVVDQCFPPQQFGRLKEYFEYRRALHPWLQKYEHIRREVDELTFDGIRALDKKTNIHEKTEDFIEVALEVCLNTIDDMAAQQVNQVCSMVRCTVEVCQVGFEEFDQLPGLIRVGLKKLEEKKEFHGMDSDIEGRLRDTLARCRIPQTTIITGGLAKRLLKC